VQTESRTSAGLGVERAAAGSPAGAGFPTVRMRRLRRTDALRRMVRETTLAVDDLILPLFVMPGRGVRQPIASMPGHFQFSLDEVAREAREVQALGVPAVLLFGLPATKDPLGSEAYAPDGIVQDAVRAVKDAAPDLVVITDVCLCEYTSHGHCGVVEDGYVLNDPSLELLARTAVSHVEAGADIVAPSDMMDGRVGAIRQALDAAGHVNTPVMAYAAKFASAFYGPFREAADSAPQFGDRRAYQMDSANAREALREVALDVAEGADLIMVKPALAYLDLVWRVREQFGLPVVAYSVSGEYAMVKAAGQLGWIDERAIALEQLTGIRRAGADLIITYFAKDVARWLSA
jgi:porphobilinogen synthase